MRSLRESGSIVAPWTSVDSTTAKNAMLKNSVLPGTPSITGNVASTIGTAPRIPAQPRIRRSPAVKCSNAVAANAASGRAIATATIARMVASNATLPRSLGNTSSPSVKNMASCATHDRPSWKPATVRLAGS